MTFRNWAPIDTFITHNGPLSNPNNYWVSNGRYILIQELTNSHLQNIVSMLYRWVHTTRDHVCRNFEKIDLHHLDCSPARWRDMNFFEKVHYLQQLTDEQILKCVPQYAAVLEEANKRGISLRQLELFPSK